MMKNYPDWRFNFSDDWQEKKAEEIFEEVSEKNHTELEVLTIIQGKGTIFRKESGIDISFTDESKSNYKKVSEGNFIIHLRSFQGGLEMANSEGIVSPAYTILKNKVSIDGKFFKFYFRSYKFIFDKLSKVVEGIRDGKQINYNQFQFVKLSLPNLDEQKKISDYLTHFDKALTSQEKKVTNWREVKKGMLQKIFSCEFRFKDDKGNDYPDWQEKKLGDLISIPISNGVFCNPKKKGTGKKIINVINLYNDFVIDEDSLELLNIDEKEFKANQVHQGDLFFTRSSLKLEGIAHCNIYFLW